MLASLRRAFLFGLCACALGCGSSDDHAADGGMHHDSGVHAGNGGLGGASGQSGASGAGGQGQSASGGVSGGGPDMPHAKVKFRLTGVR